MEGYVALGKVLRAHGIRGRLKVRPYNADSESFARLREVLLCPKKGAAHKFLVLSCDPADREYLLHLDGVDTREAAEVFTGAELLVPRSELPALPPGEHYIADLIGMFVVTEDDFVLGTLVDVMETGANDVLVVKPERGHREILLPDIPEVVLSIDDVAGRIVVRPLPGLLDQ